MSTSLLYHACGIAGYHYVSSSFQEGQVTFRIEQPRERHRCSACGSTEVWDQGGVERTFRTVPIGSKPTFVKLKVPRVLCFNCVVIRQVKVGFADPTKPSPRPFELYLLPPPLPTTTPTVPHHPHPTSPT